VDPFTAVLSLPLDPNVAFDRDAVRMDVNDCVKGREMRVLAVAIFAPADTLPWASVAA